MDAGYLSQQVTTIINQLHGYFDEIGVPSHERDSRESELFSALSETLHNQLKLVATEKHDLTEQARQHIKLIRQLEASLDDTKPRDDYEREDDELRVTYPLLQCLDHLKRKHQTISKLHRERFEQVKKLAEALASYASHIEPSFLTIKLPPMSPNSKIPPTFDISNNYVAAIDAEFTRVYDEYNRRVATVQSFAEEIVMLWSELGTPQAQIDNAIIKNYRDAPEQLGLHQDDLNRIKGKRDKLMDEKRAREKRLKDLKATVEMLWDKLSVEQADRKAFLAANRGCGLRQINEFEDELAKLEEMKRQNLHLFVEDARFKLQNLWDSLYFSEEEMLEFTPAFSDVYSDALLSAHEAEIARLEALKEQRAPTLAMVDKHRSLIKDREDLSASSQDASRLMAKGQKGEKRDPGKLLREEKMRKRIAKELPKVEAELRNVLEAWEDEYGRPFLVHGERYLDELDAVSAPTSRAAAAPARSKTPCNPPPSANTKSARTAPPASRNGTGTVRGAPPPRSKTPTASIARNPLASSTMGPPSAASSSVLKSSVFGSSTIGRTSPSKIPGARAPLGTMADGKNSPERRARPQVAAQDKEDFGSTLKARMGPPRLPPPKMKDLYTHAPPTPTPSQMSNSSDRTGSIVRHVDPEDVYDDRTHRSHPSWSTNSSTSRPGSVLQHPQYRAGAGYPAAPPAAYRNGSHTSSVMTAQSGSENWETYTDASQEDEPDARDAYFAKVRSAKRLTPDDDELHEQQIDMVKRLKGYTAAGLGIKNAPTSAIMRMVNEREGTVEGSEAAWTETDDGEVF